MKKVKVVYSIQYGNKTYPWWVQEKVGFFRWVSRGFYATKQQALDEAHRLEQEPYEGEAVYQTVFGYGD